MKSIRLLFNIHIASVEGNVGAKIMKGQLDFTLIEIILHHYFWAFSPVAAEISRIQRVAQKTKAACQLLPCPAPPPAAQFHPM